MVNNASVYVYFRIHPITGERSIVTVFNDRAQQEFNSHNPIMVPLIYVTQSEKDMIKTREMVQGFANEQNMIFELVKFSKEETIELFHPNRKEETLT